MDKTKNKASECSKELANSTTKAYHNIAEELISLFNNGYFKSVLLSKFLQSKLSVSLSPLQYAG